MNRFEDRGLTLRLFRDEQDVKSSDCTLPTHYACGFIAKNSQGRWVDAHGPLPLDWVPLSKHLVTAEDEHHRVAIEAMTGRTMEQWAENNLLLAELEARKADNSGSAPVVRDLRCTPS